MLLRLEDVQAGTGEMCHGLWEFIWGGLVSSPLALRRLCYRGLSENAPTANRRCVVRRRLPVKNAGVASLGLLDVSRRLNTRLESEYLGGAGR